MCFFGDDASRDMFHGVFCTVDVKGAVLVASNELDVQMHVYHVFINDN